MEDKQKTKKGKNFGPEEERQLCKSFLHVSQDRLTGTGQKSVAFWKRIMEHYNSSRPLGTGPRPWRSLETKWASIKGDVSKFSRYFVQVEGSGCNDEDKLKQALDVFRINSAKNSAFTFLHCWEILKDIPQWATYRDADKVTSVKRKSVGSEVSTPSASIGEDASSPSFEPPIVASVKTPNKAKRVKYAKEEARLAASKDIALKALAKATSELAAACMERNTILKDQAALALFTLPDLHLLEDDAREYIARRRAEELQILRARQSAEGLVSATNPTSEPPQDMGAALASQVPAEGPFGCPSAPLSSSSDHESEDRPELGDMQM